MRVIITGGAGFIGSNIGDLLISQGHEITVIDNLLTGKQENINSVANFYNVDIRDSAIDEIFVKVQPDYVIHHAAQIDVQSSLLSPTEDASINILGTINLLKTCVKAGVKKLIYASSAAVYGAPHYLGVDEKHPICPESFYGISKYTPEHYIRIFSEITGLKYTVLRYANVFGPRQDPTGEGGVVAIFVNKMLKGVAPIIYGSGEQTRDFVYVKDVARANLAALTNGDNQVINISCNKQTTVNQLFETLNNSMCKDLRPIYKEARAGDILHSYLNNSIAQEILEWAPVYSLEQGLRETIEYFSTRTP
jgi:UDP-glucose 4-epimerase